MRAARRLTGARSPSTPLVPSLFMEVLNMFGNMSLMEVVVAERLAEARAAAAQDRLRRCGAPRDRALTRSDTVTLTSSVEVLRCVGTCC